MVISCRDYIVAAKTRCGSRVLFMVEDLKWRRYIGIGAIEWVPVVYTTIFVFAAQLGGKGTAVPPRQKVLSYKAMHCGEGRSMISKVTGQM